MGSKKNKKKRNKAAASSSGRVPQDNKTPKELKAKGELAKKSANLNSQMKEAEATPRSQSRNKENIKDGNQGTNAEATPRSQSINKEKNIKDGNQGNNLDKKDARKSLNINSGNKGKGSTSEMSVDVKDGKAEKGVGGVIFMCNGQTKNDCFRYHVMGVSAMKKDIIMGIKPGVKLFLFDVDLKLMYGIYEASSSGGMKLEPAAFGGNFPAQVRFRIDKDCLPLPENLFKRAIKDNYNEWTHKFKTELTFKQVEQLKKLFRPVPRLRPAFEHFVSEPVTLSPSAASLPSKESSREHAYGMQYSRSKAGENFSSYGHERENQQHAGRHIMPREVDSEPRFLTEKEYRSYGLQSAKHFQPTASAVVDRTLDHNEFEQGREHLRRNATGVNSDAALARKETVSTDPLYPVLTYGLKARSEIPDTVAPAVESSATGISATSTNHALLDHVKDAYNPYDETTTSLVNRYLSLPRTVLTPVDSYSSAGRESFVSDPYSAIGIRDHAGKFHTENERVYPPTRRFHTEDERAYPPTGRFHIENERAYPPTGRSRPEDERAYPPTGRSHPENGRAYPPTGRSHPEDERAYPPTERSHPENGRAYPPTGRSHPEDERAYPPTGRSNPENGRAYPPTGRSHPEDERAYPPTGRSHPEDERAYPPTGRSHPENGRAYPPTGRSHPEDERAYPPTGISHPEDERAYPPTGRSHPEDERAYPPTGRSHPENGRAYPPTGRSHPEDERAYPPTGRSHPENERGYPPYAPQLPPDYGLNPHHVRDEPIYPTSVSSRYSFEGPSAPRR